MDSYLLLKSLHIVGVVLFIGNITITGWWKAMADRTKDGRIIAFAQHQVSVTDWVFTLGGVVLVGVGGYGNAMMHDMPLSTPWLLEGSVLFIASGLIWIGILVPLQTKLARLAKTFASAEAIPAQYWRLERLWYVFGLLATVLPLAVIPIMVFKPS